MATESMSPSPHLDSSDAWLLLLLAGVFEIAFAVSMKFTSGFTRVGPSVLTTGLAVASVALLSRALVVLPVGTAYAAWTGIGAAGAALVGMVALHEPRGAARLLSVGLIIAGVICLRRATPDERRARGSTPSAHTTHTASR